MKNLVKLSILSIFISIVVFSCKKEDEIFVPQVLGIADKINGYGYKEMGEASIKWLFSKAPDPKTSPFLDETGDLSRPSSQPIAGYTILASNFGGNTTRSTTVSASNYVYVAAYGALVWYYDNDTCDPDFKPKAGQSDLAFLSEAFKDFVDMSKVKVSVKIDGIEYMTDLAKYKIATDVFQATIDAGFNNPKCDYSNQKAKIYGEDYAIILKLPKGKHILVMKGEDSSNNFEATVTWNLTVE